VSLADDQALGQAVEALIRDVAASEIAPRFGTLAKGEISEKKPGDYVTVVDAAAERRLTAGLLALTPDVPVVGEEAVESDPGLLELVRQPSASCWIVDPLDGTANFASATPIYAVIVALMRNGRTEAGWIYDVPGDRMASAWRGRGVLRSGRAVPPDAARTGRRGYVGYKIKRTFDRHLVGEGSGDFGEVTTMGCAGVEYLDLLDGRADYCLYRITKPWDHAAGALMMEEVGGGALAFDGGSYAPGQGREAGLLASPQTRTLTELHPHVSALARALTSG